MAKSLLMTACMPSCPLMPTPAQPLAHLQLQSLAFSKADRRMPSCPLMHNPAHLNIDIQIRSICCGSSGSRKRNCAMAKSLLMTACMPSCLLMPTPAQPLAHHQSQSSAVSKADRRPCAQCLDRTSSCAPAGANLDTQRWQPACPPARWCPTLHITTQRYRSVRCFGSSDS